jgi:hypothetical protein
LKRDDEGYVLGVVEKQFKYFGPFPAKVAEITDPETVLAIVWIMERIPGEQLAPFSRITQREVSQRDNIFIANMMRLDWRDRPTAKELLEDEWWNADAE